MRKIILFLIITIVLSISCYATIQDAKDNAIHYYTGDNTLASAISNGSNLVLQEGVNTIYRPGLIGNAIASIDPTNISTYINTTFQGDGIRTIDFWFFFNVTTGDNQNFHIIIMKETAYNNKFEFFRQGTGSNLIIAHYKTSYSCSNSYSFTNVREWTHIVALQNETHLVTWINGTNKQSLRCNSSIPDWTINNTFNNYHVFGDSGTGNDMKGKIDNILMTGYEYDDATALASFNSTNGVEFFSTCSENWSCNGYDTCLINDTQYCNSVTDTNACGTSYTGDYSEFSTQVCDNCTPSWSCDGYVTCNKPEFNSSCNSADDSNGCFAITSLSSDQYSGNYTEFSVQTCEYSDDVGKLWRNIIPQEEEQEEVEVIEKEVEQEQPQVEFQEKVDIFVGNIKNTFNSIVDGTKNIFDKIKKLIDKVK